MIDNDLKEQKLLQRLLKEKARPKPKLYLWYMIFILTLIYIVDEVATNLPNSLETEINLFLNVWPKGSQFGVNAISSIIYNGSWNIKDVFDEVTTLAANGLSSIGLIKLIANATLVASMFYRPLADKYGRKLFLFVNTLGMAAALLIMFTASNLIVYTIGFFALRFFVTPDQQIIYLYEIAPEKMRGTLLSLTKGIAEFGLIFIWLLRKLFLSQTEFESYKKIFFVVAVAAFVVAFIALFFSRESDIFLDSRIEYLQKTKEEREKEKIEHDASKAQGGFISAIKYGLKNKQLRWILIATAIVEIGYSCCNSYSNVLTNGVFGVGGLNQLEATDVTFWFPFSCALLTLIYGFISDKIGRKKIMFILLTLATMGFIVEFIALYYALPKVIIGLALGIVLGADWALGDVLALMAGESCTTNLRSSIMSVWSLFFGFGMLSSMAITAILPKVLGLANLSIGYFLVAVPGWIIGSIILSVKVKETAGADLYTVGKE